MWLENCNAEWMRDYNPNEDEIVIALILAIKYGDRESIQALVPLQPDINARDKSELYWTPLMYAVFEESLDVVKLLVEAGADVNARGSDPNDFPLNLSAYACSDTFYHSHEFTRNKKIFDYLAPLTSPELQAIAYRTLKQRN